MPIRVAIILAIFLVALTAAGCGAFYSSDGHLSDRGWFATPRYELDLGPVDLTRIGDYAYRLIGLPDAEFVAGFEIVEGNPNNDAARPSNPSIIRLELRNSDRGTVVSEYGPLDSWIWSYGRDQRLSFLYRRGEESKIPVGNGIVRLQRVGVKVDGGWGTYFTPKGTTTYTLTLSVVAAQQPPQQPTRLLLRGGGWK